MLDGAACWRCSSRVEGLSSGVWFWGSVGHEGWGVGILNMARMVGRVVMSVADAEAISRSFVVVFGKVGWLERWV